MLTCTSMLLRVTGIQVYQRRTSMEVWWHLNFLHDSSFNQLITDAGKNEKNWPPSPDTDFYWCDWKLGISIVNDV